MSKRLGSGKYTAGQTAGLYMMSLGSMFAGATFVHYIYKPNLVRVCVSGLGVGNLVRVCVWGGGARGCEWAPRFGGVDVCNDERLLLSVFARKVVAHHAALTPAGDTAAAGAARA
jgi:hypothetical protein